MKPLIIFFVLVCFSAEAFAADFRNANWGMSYNQVAKLNKGVCQPLDPKDPSLVTPSLANPTKLRRINLPCQVAIGGVSGVNLLYYFTDLKLTNGFYQIRNDPSEADYAKQYKAVYELIVKEYGKPQKSKTVGRKKIEGDDSGMEREIKHNYWENKKNVVMEETVTLYSGNKVEKLTIFDVIEKKFFKEERHKDYELFFK